MLETTVAAAREFTGCDVKLREVPGEPGHAQIEPTVKGSGEARLTKASKWIIAPPPPPAPG